MQEFLAVTACLALSRTQQTALGLVDRVEELAVDATFVQARS